MWREGPRGGFPCPPLAVSHGPGVSMRGPQKFSLRKMMRQTQLS